MHRKEQIEHIKNNKNLFLILKLIGRWGNLTNSDLAKLMGVKTQQIITWMNKLEPFNIEKPKDKNSLGLVAYKSLLGKLKFYSLTESGQIAIGMTRKVSKKVEGKKYMVDRALFKCKHNIYEYMHTSYTIDILLEFIGKSERRIKGNLAFSKEQIKIDHSSYLTPRDMMQDRRFSEQLKWLDGFIYHKKGVNGVPDYHRRYPDLVVNKNNSWFAIEIENNKKTRKRISEIILSLFFLKQRCLFEKVIVFANDKNASFNLWTYMVNNGYKKYNRLNPMQAPTQIMKLFNRSNWSNELKFPEQQEIW